MAPMPTCCMEKFQIRTLASNLAISRFGRKILEIWCENWVEKDRKAGDDSASP